jgi:hypothetical protein
MAVQKCCLAVLIGHVKNIQQYFSFPCYWNSNVHKHVRDTNNANSLLFLCLSLQQRITVTKPFLSVCWYIYLQYPQYTFFKCHTIIFRRSLSLVYCWGFCRACNRYNNKFAVCFTIRYMSQRIPSSTTFISLFLSLLTDSFLLEYRIESEHLSKKLGRIRTETCLSRFEVPSYLQTNIQEKVKSG